MGMLLHRKREDNSLPVESVEVEPKPTPSDEKEVVEVEVKNSSKKRNARK